ncbi:VOC family protein [Pseudoruegeria sp. HB172150]|uniref:VOC family protein n=1 Tax=Pseudoruegeria sp. HB172150 TaxID=2721164 RepID=UPI001555CA0D|nr:VOC family protein [Pseudoruegeria sp. HB172150]
MQQISLITLGIGDMARSTRFYAEGFGWTPVFETPEITFYQMNGLVFSTFLRAALEEDMNQTGLRPGGAYAMAHNVGSEGAVTALMERLITFGGSLLRAADAPEHGGFRGYVADPDGHPWEIAWNPAWPIDGAGHVTFGL